MRARTAVTGVDNAQTTPWTLPEMQGGELGVMQKLLIERDRRALAAGYAAGYAAGWQQARPDDAQYRRELESTLRGMRQMLNSSANGVAQSIVDFACEIASAALRAPVHRDRLSGIEPAVADAVEDVLRHIGHPEVVVRPETLALIRSAVSRVPAAAGETFTVDGQRVVADPSVGTGKCALRYSPEEVAAYGQRIERHVLQIVAAIETAIPAPRGQSLGPERSAD